MTPMYSYRVDFPTGHVVELRGMFLPFCRPGKTWRNDVLRQARGLVRDRYSMTPPAYRARVTRIRGANAYGLVTVVRGPCD